MQLDIDVYYVLYEGHIDPPLQQRALALLDDAEQQRYKAFKVNHAAEQFLMGRLLAKTASARALGIMPQNCRIALSDNGKPHIEDYPDFHFSIAHCHGAVIVACGQQPLGVDVEQAQRFVDREMLNTHFFPQAVVDNIADLRARQGGTLPIEQLPVLYWSSMEAIAKLEDSSIFHQRGQFNSLLNHKLEYARARDISLVSWKIDDNVFASLALQNPENAKLNLHFHAVAGIAPEHFDFIARTRELDLAWQHQN